MVPESVVRAIAAAPDTDWKWILLGSLGLDENLKPISEEARQASLKMLETLARLER